MTLLSAGTVKPRLRPAFPPGSPGFLWWEWLVETTFPVPGAPTALGMVIVSGTSQGTDNAWKD